MGSAADQLTPSSSDLLLYIRPTAVLKTWSQELLPILATAPSMSQVSGTLLAKLMLYMSHERPCNVAALRLISLVPENASQQKSAVHCVQGGYSRAVSIRKPLPVVTLALPKLRGLMNILLLPALADCQR